ncbi:uncharacterized protein LOC134243358 [Saccostrea cucullata]|uniref:uncharacterized protein LOC134243358 n=1 Tax=Saccostrea cuccullata TaxID=36930 RepID=UPI002ED38136
MSFIIVFLLISAVGFNLKADSHAQISTNDSTSKIAKNVTDIQTDYTRTDANVELSSDDTTRNNFTEDINIQMDNITKDVINATMHNDFPSRPIANDTSIQEHYTKTDVYIETLFTDNTLEISTYKTNIEINNISSNQMIKDSTYGISGAAIVIFIGIICLITWLLRRKKYRQENHHGWKKSKVHEVGLPNNPLYHCFDSIEFSNEKKSKDQKDGSLPSTNNDDDAIQRQKKTQSMIYHTELKSRDEAKVASSYL